MLRSICYPSFLIHRGNQGAYFLVFHCLVPYNWQINLEVLPEVVFEALFFILFSGEKLFLLELADLIYELAENPT